MAWTFRWLRFYRNGQVEVTQVKEVTSTKLVEEVRYFLGGIAQVAELAKPHLISATISCHLNAPQMNLFFPPPRRGWVISRQRFARAQILQRIPKQLP